MALKGDFIATGSILARHIKASQSITTPILSSPTINAGQINSTAINNGNGNFTVDAAGNLYAKSGRFEGEVYAGRLTGNVLSSYEVMKTGIGTYGVAIPPLEGNALIHVSFLVTSGQSPKANAYDTGRILGTRRNATIKCNGQQLIQHVYGVVSDWWYEYPKTFTTISENVQMCGGMFKVPLGQSISVSVVVRNYQGNLLNATGIVIASVMPIK